MSNLLKPAKIIFNYTDDFTQLKWNQCKVNIEIKLPIVAKKKVEVFKDILYEYCTEIFENTDEHCLWSIKFGILMDMSVAKNDKTATIDIYTKNQIYQNFLSKILDRDIDSIEKRYIIEACNCAMNNQRLAAATMIGCAAECLLFQLCNSYLEYLKNGNGSESECIKFEKECVKAKKASARLDYFKKTVQNKESLFKSLNLEKSNLHFSFLDIIRQVRNESGHPTGIIISNEDLNTIFGNYQLLIDRVHPILKKLPLYDVN